MGFRGHSIAVACVLLLVRVPVAADSPEPTQATLVIDGSPIALATPPFVVRQTVFVPVRGVFERLGAEVTSTRGEIDVATAAHRLALHVGLPLVTIDGIGQILTTPPTLIDGHTYVPLRVVADALGVRVRFDRSARIVFIERPALQPDTARARSSPPIGSPGPSLGEPPASSSPAPPSPTGIATLVPGSIALRLVREEPARGTSVARSRPEISAAFAERIEPASIHLVVDGHDVTAAARISERSFVFEPSAELTLGVHDVSVSGRTPLHEPFADRWTFTTERPHGHNFLTGLEPPSGIVVSNPVVIDGLTRPHAHVGMVATSSETASHFSELAGGAISAGAVADDRGRFSFHIDLVDMGAGFLDVRLASVAADGGIAVRTLRLRL